MIDEIKLKTYDATLWLYHCLYIKECARGGVNDDEFEEMKLLFLEACREVVSILKDFAREYFAVETDDVDTLIELAEKWRVVHYDGYWKKMMHNIRPCVEENRLSKDDIIRLLQAYDLLKIPNYALAAWTILEKETGESGRNNPELLRKLQFFLSVDAVFRNRHAGVSFVTQAEIWSEAEKRARQVKDIHSDSIYALKLRLFDELMDAYIEKQGLERYKEIPVELKDKFTGNYREWMLSFEGEIEVAIVTALKNNDPIVFDYYRFWNGKSLVWKERVIPHEMKYVFPNWHLIGADSNGIKKEYVIRQILEVKNAKQEEIEEIRKRIHRTISPNKNDNFSTTIRDEELSEGVTYLPTKTTGLSHDIIVDCGETYRVFNHDLCLYVVNGDDVYPVLIAEQPTCPLNIDVPSNIKLFIQNNMDALIQFANMKIGGGDFFDILKSQRKKTAPNAFQLDDIPMEVLDKSYRRYEPFNLTITHRHPLNGVYNEKYYGIIDKAKEVLLSTYDPLSPEQFVIENGQQGVSAAILVSFVDTNVEVIETAMQKLGFTRTAIGMLHDAKNRVWVELKFEHVGQPLSLSKKV